jgi:hypothetical protein
MATNNRRVAAYLPDSVYEKLEQFKNERDITFSQALIAVLCGYFDLEPIPVKVSDYSSSTITSAQIEALERRLSGLSESVDERFRELAESIFTFQGGGSSFRDSSSELLSEIGRLSEYRVT